LADYVKSGRVRALGISNVTISTLSCLIEFSESRIKPSFVQNRFYADTEYEVSMREICKKEGIKFQTFWTLTGNPHLLKSEEVAWVSQKTGTSKEVALYALVLGLGNTMILNGTTNAAHMKADLEGLDIIKGWSEQAGKSEWEEALWGFTNVIGDAAPL
jgi:diketogulonate reductase-like aldo/keto reductase